MDGWLEDKEALLASSTEEKEGLEGLRARETTLEEVAQLWLKRVGPHVDRVCKLTTVQTNANK